MEEINEKVNSTSFESLDILIKRWREGTLKEILDDWKWIFSYSLRYKGGYRLLPDPGDFQYDHGIGG